MATLIFSFATYEFSRKFFVFFYFWFAALTTTSLLRLRRGGKESRGGETGGRRKLDSQAGQRASLFAAINITHPPSLMSHANPHHQNVKNTDHHQSARKAIRLLPTPRRRGWEESIRVYARARVWPV